MIAKNRHELIATIAYMCVLANYLIFDQCIFANNIVCQRMKTCVLLCVILSELMPIFLYKYYNHIYILRFAILFIL